MGAFKGFSYVSSVIPTSDYTLRLKSCAKKAFPKSMRVMADCHADCPVAEWGLICVSDQPACQVLPASPFSP